MKYRVKQRVPQSFIFGYDKPDMVMAEAEFDTAEQLCQVPFIASFTKAKGFVRLSKSRMRPYQKSNQQYLIAEFSGYVCVIGFLYGCQDLDLPETD